MELLTKQMTQSIEVGREDTPMPAVRNKIRISLPVLVLLGTVVLVALVYRPGMDGPFLFDDQGNILLNPGVRMQEFTWEYLREAALSTYGTTSVNRPLARLSFGLNYYFAGKEFSALHFKITNLVIHVINGVLLFCLMSLLLKALRRRGESRSGNTFEAPLWNWLPVLVTVVWLLHPIQLTSILYVVQRMTSMAGTGVLLGLTLFALGRLRLGDGKSWGMTTMVIGVGVGTVLGVASKENAVLTPLFACLLELFFFERNSLALNARRRLRWLYGLLSGILVLTALAIGINSYYFIVDIYEIRNFTLVERLLTQPRVLWYYIGLIVLPNVRNFGLFHDYFVLSDSLFSPWTTGLALAMFAAALIFALWGLRSRNLLAFCVLWFLLGHSVESSILGLELVHEHRNYMPSIGPIFAICFSALWLADNWHKLRRPIAILACCYVAVISFATHARANAWETRDGIFYFAVRNHPDSYRAHLGYGAMLQTRGGDIDRVYEEYRTAARLNPYNVLPAIRMQRIISGVIHQLEVGTLLEQEGVTAIDELSLYEAPLVFQLTYMRTLDGLVSEEITHRIKNFALDAESSVALNELRQCVGSEFHTCPPADRVESWVRLILDHKELSSTQQMVFLVTLARVVSYRGEVEESVALLEKAVGLTTNDTGILIEMAMILGKHGELESAVAMLDRIERLVQESGRSARNFRELQAYLEERQREEGASPPVSETEDW